MLVKALKDFPYSPDGIHNRSAKAGSEVDIPTNLIAGLVAGGFIENPDPEVYQTKVVDSAAEIKTLTVQIDEEKVRLGVVADTYRELARGITERAGLELPKDGEDADAVLAANLAHVAENGIAGSGELSPAAAVLAVADGDWNTFKALAGVVLGDEAPSKKAEIIAALEAKVQAEAGGGD